MPDLEDAFAFDPNESSDFDGDGIGDGADLDDDGDGVPDVEDPLLSIQRSLPILMGTA